MMRKLSDEQHEQIHRIKRENDSGPWVIGTVFLGPISMVPLVMMFSGLGGNPNWGLIIAIWAGFGACLYMYKSKEDNGRRELEKYMRSIGVTSWSTDGVWYYENEGHSNSSSVSSKWEDEIADFVKSEAQSHAIMRNDRSVIPGRDGGGNLEIDIYIPSLKLGIECNGVRWHDKGAYERDKRNGTQISDEMYKEKYCARRGIRLIHVWDDMPMASIQSCIRDAVRNRK